MNAPPIARILPRTAERASTVPPHTCRHCGAALIDTRMRETGFCCSGCAYVHRLVNEHGLAGYYRIKDAVTAPADAAVFQTRDYAWLETAQREAEAAAPAAGVTELILDVQGISCAGCVWLIEHLFQQQPGARTIDANAQFGTLRLRWSRGVFSAVDFARKLQAFGYLVGPAGEEEAEPESRGLVRRIGLCAAFAMNVMLYTLPVYFGMEPSFEYARLFGVLSLVFGTLSLLVGGSYFLSRAIRALREGLLHIDLPIALGIIGAYGGSLYGWFAGEERFVYFDFVSAFILLMLIGRWAQVAAVERNRRRLLRGQAKPRQVRVVAADGTLLSVATERLAGTETLVIGPGQVVPVEAKLETSAAAFSLASINGEAEPRLFQAGQRVPSGAESLAREDIRLVAQQAWSESLLAQLLAPAARSTGRSALLEKIIRGYLVGIIGIALAAGVGWAWTAHDVARAWSIVTAVLVVSCPCAIGLAFPLADEMATVALRRRGVFVRDADLWLRLGRVRKLIFDKTGTLTLETPVLKNPEAIGNLGPDARAALLALVRDNPHPVSQCLAEHLLALGGDRPAEGTIRETVGCGVQLIPPAGFSWTLGRPGWNPSLPGLMRPDDDARMRGDVVLAQGGSVVATFHTADAARADARTELAALQARGLETYVLSGDGPGKVATLAKALGFPEGNAVGGLSPQGKADWLAVHTADDALMLGDGANDSLAFDRALCRGTPVIHRGLLEQKADFYYLGRGIAGIRALFEADAVRRRTQRTILIFSVAYNLTVVGLAVSGRVNPLVAAILMPVSSLTTLAIVGWGMRPLLKKSA
jgi:Cu2+-exporting ATPase